MDKEVMVEEEEAQEEEADMDRIYCVVFVFKN